MKGSTFPLFLALPIAVYATTCGDVKQVYLDSTCCGADPTTASTSLYTYTPSISTALAWNRPIDITEDADYVYIALTGSVETADYASLAVATPAFNFTALGYEAFCAPACGTELYGAATKTSGGKIVRMSKSDPTDVITILEVPTFDTYSATADRTPNLFGQGSGGILSVTLVGNKLFFGMHNSFGNMAPTANGISGAGGVFYIDNPNDLTGLAPSFTKIFDAATESWSNAAGVAGQGPNGLVKPAEGLYFVPVDLTLIDGKLYGSDGNEDCIYEMTESNGMWSLNAVTHVPWKLDPSLVYPADGTLQSSVPTCILTHGSTSYVALYGGAFSSDQRGALYSVPNADIMDHNQWTLLASGFALMGITKCAITTDGSAIVATTHVGLQGVTPYAIKISTVDGTVSTLLDTTTTKMSVAISTFDGNFTIGEEYLNVAEFASNGVKVDHMLASVSHPFLTAV